MKLLQKPTPAFVDCDLSIPSLPFKERLRPLGPRFGGSTAVDTTAAKSFNKHVQQLPTQKPASSTPPVSGWNPTHLPSQRQLQSGGGTRWNPTPEQIEALEALYRGGVRTPNARQIDHITVELSKYGKIEGKNVFYWFQNHKARERQKQKRGAMGVSLGSDCESTAGRGVKRDNTGSRCKRRCRSWSTVVEERDDRSADSADERILELFPLHPEGK